MSLSVQFPTYGTTEVLQIVDAAPLDAGPGRVRLRVHAAGVNPADWKIMGLISDQIPLNLPAGLGSDVTGVSRLSRRGPHVLPR
jgi:NADPH:quinone reductase-like Zn-dependent oxidoreductase